MRGASQVSINARAFSNPFQRSATQLDRRSSAAGGAGAVHGYTAVKPRDISKIEYSTSTERGAGTINSIISLFNIICDMIEYIYHNV